MWDVQDRSRHDPSTPFHKYDDAPWLGGCCFEQVGGEAMAQGVDATLLLDAGP